MFQPLFDNKKRRRVSDVQNFPAPVGGWASDNSFAADNPNTALLLRNLVPNAKTIIARSGSLDISSVVGGVRSLLSYEGVQKKLLAAAADKMWEIPFSGPGGVGPSLLELTTPIELASGLTSSEWQYVSFANAADVTKLVCVNGHDGMWVYDGLTFARHNPTTNDLLSFSNITSFKGRIWCTDLGSSVVYYGEPLSNSPVNMTPFPVGPFLRKGGSIILIDSISVDGGSGPDDYLVMISDRGDLLMWSGIDPSDDFALVGVFSVGMPLGRRCLKKAGVDLVYFSQSGPALISTLLPAAGTLRDPFNVPIRPEFDPIVAKNYLAFGWDVVQYSKRGWMVFNIPITAPTVYRQFCVYMDSQAWFEITDWNALCWVEHGDWLLFGTSLGKIVLADYGKSDNGSAILVDFMQSWYEFGQATKKKFNMAQMTIKSNVKPDIAVDMMTDFKNVLPKSTPAFAQKAVASPWNVSPWNISPWSGTDRFYVSQFGLNSAGFVGALRYRASLNEASHELYGYRVAYEQGDI